MPAPSATIVAIAMTCGARLCRSRHDHRSQNPTPTARYQLSWDTGSRPPRGDPSEMMRPSLSSTTRSATRAIARLCVTTITVRPASDCARSKREDLHTGAEVELAGRLVGEQDRVCGRERACDRDALLLAARQLVGIVVQPLTEPHLLQDLGRSLGRALASRDLGAEPYVLQRGQLGEQVERLEDEAHRLAAIVEQARPRSARQATTRNLDRPARRRVERADHVQERRLAASRRSEHDEQLAPVDRQRRRLQRDDRAGHRVEPLSDILQLYEWPGRSGQSQWDSVPELISAHHAILRNRDGRP